MAKGKKSGYRIRTNRVFKAPPQGECANGAPSGGKLKWPTRTKASHQRIKAEHSSAPSYWAWKKED